MITEPVFARPPSRIIRFSNQHDYVDFLRQHHVPSEQWTEEERSKAWKEIVEGDAVYCIDPNFTAMQMPVRCICVIAIRVILIHPTLGILVLVEFVRKGDFYCPRRQIDSSLSEKVILDPATGLPIETSVETIIRCLKQETGLIVPKRELISGATTFMPRIETPQIPAHFGQGAYGVEQEFGPTEKYPVLQTYRQVAHYKVALHRRHHYRRGHRDPTTRYYSFWRSVSEKGGLVPISVEDIRTRKKAPA